MKTPFNEKNLYDKSFYCEEIEIGNSYLVCKLEFIYQYLSQKKAFINENDYLIKDNLFDFFASISYKLKKNTSYEFEQLLIKSFVEYFFIVSPNIKFEYETIYFYFQQLHNLCNHFIDKAKEISLNKSNFDLKRNFVSDFKNLLNRIEKSNLLNLLQIILESSERDISAIERKIKDITFVLVKTIILTSYSSQLIIVISSIISSLADYYKDKNIPNWIFNLFFEISIQARSSDLSIKIFNILNIKSQSEITENLIKDFASKGDKIFFKNFNANDILLILSIIYKANYNYLINSLFKQDYKSAVDLLKNKAYGLSLFKILDYLLFESFKIDSLTDLSEINLKQIEEFIIQKESYFKLYIQILGGNKKNLKNNNEQITQSLHEAKITVFKNLNKLLCYEKYYSTKIVNLIEECIIKYLTQKNIECIIVLIEYSKFKILNRNVMLSVQNFISNTDSEELYYFVKLNFTLFCTIYHNNYKSFVNYLSTTKNILLDQYSFLIENIVKNLNRTKDVLVELILKSDVNNHDSYFILFIMYSLKYHPLAYSVFNKFYYESTILLSLVVNTLNPNEENFKNAQQSYIKKFEYLQKFILIFKNQSIKNSFLEIIKQSNLLSKNILVAKLIDQFSSLLSEDLKIDEFILFIKYCFVFYPNKKDLDSLTSIIQSYDFNFMDHEILNSKKYSSHSFLLSITFHIISNHFYFFNSINSKQQFEDEFDKVTALNLVNIVINNKIRNSLIIDSLILMFQQILFFLPKDIKNIYLNNLFIYCIRECRKFNFEYLADLVTEDNTLNIDIDNIRLRDISEIESIKDFKDQNKVFNVLNYIKFYNIILFRILNRLNKYYISLDEEIIDKYEKTVSRIYSLNIQQEMIDLKNISCKKLSLLHKLIFIDCDSIKKIKNNFNLEQDNQMYGKLSELVQYILSLFKPILNINLEVSKYLILTSIYRQLNHSKLEYNTKNNESIDGIIDNLFDKFVEDINIMSIVNIESEISNSYTENESSIKSEQNYYYVFQTVKIHEIYKSIDFIFFLFECNVKIEMSQFIEISSLAINCSKSIRHYFLDKLKDTTLNSNAKMIQSNLSLQFISIFFTDDPDKSIRSKAKDVFHRMINVLIHINTKSTAHNKMISKYYIESYISYLILFILFDFSCIQLYLDKHNYNNNYFEKIIDTFMNSIYKSERHDFKYLSSVVKIVRNASIVNIKVRSINGSYIIKKKYAIEELDDLSKSLAQKYDLDEAKNLLCKKIISMCNVYSSNINYESNPIYLPNVFKTTNSKTSDRVLISNSKNQISTINNENNRLIHENKSDHIFSESNFESFDKLKVDNKDKEKLVIFTNKKYNVVEDDTLSDELEKLESEYRQLRINNNERKSIRQTSKRKRRKYIRRI